MDKLKNIWQSHLNLRDVCMTVYKPCGISLDLLYHIEIEILPFKQILVFFG